MQRHEEQTPLPPTDTQTGERVNLHDLSMDELMIALPEQVRRYEQMRGVVAEIAAEMHRRDPDRWSWRALGDHSGLYHTRLWRWVQHYTEPEADQ